MDDNEENKLVEQAEIEDANVAQNAKRVAENAERQAKNAEKKQRKK